MQWCSAQPIHQYKTIATHYIHNNGEGWCKYCMLSWVFVCVQVIRVHW